MPETVTLDSVRQGLVTMGDLSIHPDTLERQAQVAEEHANPQLAANFRRAAELTALADQEVLDLYEALRPAGPPRPSSPRWPPPSRTAACPAARPCSPRPPRSTPAAA